MTTSQKTSLSSQLQLNEPLSEFTKAYFRERTRNRIYTTVMAAFSEAKALDNLTQAEIARRLSVSPALVNRWLGAPGNWTIDTVSDLLLAISACELETGVAKIKVAERRNHAGPDWLKLPNEEQSSAKVLVVQTGTPIHSWEVTYAAEAPASISVANSHEFKEFEVVP